MCTSDLGSCCRHNNTLIVAARVTIRTLAVTAEPTRSTLKRHSFLAPQTLDVAANLLNRGRQTLTFAANLLKKLRKCYLNVSSSRRTP
jgi:hypothetical protein